LSSPKITFLGAGLGVGLLDHSGLGEEDWFYKLHRLHDGLEQLSSAFSFPRIEQQVVLGVVDLWVHLAQLRQLRL